MRLFNKTRLFGLLWINMHLRKSRIFYLLHPLTLFAFVLYIKIISIVFPDFMFGINLNLDLRSSKTLGTCTVESVDSAFDERECYIVFNEFIFYILKL